MKGKSRSGKTAAAGSYPTPSLFLDLDGRWATLKKHFDGRDITVESFGPDEFKRLAEFTGRLEQGCKYKTVCIDGLTSFANLVLEYALTLKGSSKGKKFGVLEVNTVEDYNVENAGITNLLSFMKHLQTQGVTSILTAHLNVVNVQPLDKPMYQVRDLMTGGKKAAAKIPGVIDEIYHFETSNNELSSTDPIGYICYTKRGGEDYADTMYPLPATFNWTNKNFYDHINSYPGMIDVRKEEDNVTKVKEEHKIKVEDFGGL